jgi:hypothetical protein
MIPLLSRKINNQQYRSSPQTTMPTTAPQANISAERKRRHHHRSRHGCFSCKQKHMRCDENKPFCRNCLKNGSSCGYSRVETSTLSQPQPLLALAPDRVSSNSLLAAYLNEPATSQLEPAMMSDAAMSPTPRFAAQSPLTTAFGVEMVDPFNGLPVVMGRNSNMLLDHCMCRISPPIPCLC